MPRKDNRPAVQHTPVHLEGDVFDKRHPAASSFAPLQPAAGVVANDVEERGQNLNGGQKADDAHAANLDQIEKLEEQHRETLQAQVDASPAPANVSGAEAKPADSSAKSSGTARS